MKRILLIPRTAALWLCATLFLIHAQGASAQNESDVPYESEFIETRDARLHYLDFGGEGLPVVLIHSEAWDAYTYKDFGGRFSDRNRVLAVTRPGYGESEGRRYDVPSQAETLIDFLDALAIDRAVFAGNASVTSELTYLAEHHPKRVAGVIYFTGLAVPWIEGDEADPTQAFEMFRRASPGSAEVAEIVRARSLYRPRFLRSDGAVITVPALAFVARSGRMGRERGVGALALVGSPLMSDVRDEMPPSPVRDHLERLATDEAFRLQQLEQIQDSVAREYFLRLAEDSTFQAEIRRYHEERILPAMLAGQDRFRRAFGDKLQLVRLDIPQVIGYEYRDSPELLEPHIRGFLEEVIAREASR